jgi:hypothetical protein
MSDLVIAWIRTITPGLVGLVIAAAAQAGIDIDSEALLVVFNGVIIGAWYLVARWLESVAPWFPWNGPRKQPRY